MRRFFALLILVLTGAFLYAAGAAWARVYIDVTQPFSRKLPLAMPAFVPLEGAPADALGKKGHGTLSSDLTFTGMFDILDPASYLGAPQVGNINYRQWSRIGAELLITGNYKVSGNLLTMEMRLYDVVEGRLLTGKHYDGVEADLPAMMHRFADDVMLAITGERSVFSSVIAFVGARQGAKGVHKEIYFMNFDGSHVRQFTHRQDIALYPAWSRDGALLAYSAYRQRRPAVFVHSLAGGEGKLTVNQPGVNLTPCFVPGGNNLAVSMSYTGKTNIYVVDIAGKVVQQLTDGWGIEVAPSFSPDGRQMAFVSDRGGTPQIYVLEVASKALRRLTFGFKYCAAPAWSPRGDRIAFQAMNDGAFQVATVRLDGGDLQVLTSGWGGGEDPSWSPDGRLIAYSGRATGNYQIYVMTAGGHPIRRLTSLPGDNTDPAWSPRGVAGK